MYFNIWDEEVDCELVTGLHTLKIYMCLLCIGRVVLKKQMTGGRHSSYFLDCCLLQFACKPLFFKKIKWRSRLSCAAAVLVSPGFPSWRFCLMYREFYSEIWNRLLSGMEENHYLCNLHDTLKSLNWLIAPDGAMDSCTDFIWKWKTNFASIYSSHRSFLTVIWR